MRMYDIIMKKRRGKELSPEEIHFWISGYTRGNIPDYQVSALLMAVCINGFNEQETAELTRAMVESGATIDLSPVPGVKVDKHSTGGVGDKTTLVLGPLVAAAGVPVAKMSGRGLGHTGGTIDKLESIPGFRVQLEREEFLRQVKEMGLAVAAQTGNLAPADKKLYALRDVTATVDSIPLIASSIMSKKIASGAGAVLLDVKYGSGAFMQNPEEARELARSMVAIGKNVNRNTTALITSMDQPLGYTVGNALEVREAVDTLGGGGPEDLRELCLVLGSKMLLLGQKAGTAREAREVLQKILQTGKALQKLKDMVYCQGGDVEALESQQGLPRAENVREVKAKGEGFVYSIDALAAGKAAMLAGAGRQAKQDSIDHAAGVVLHKKTGVYVRAGETLAELHFNSAERAETARELLAGAFVLSGEPPETVPLVWGEEE